MRGQQAGQRTVGIANHLWLRRRLALEPATQQALKALLLPLLVNHRASGQDRQPTPKDVFALETFYVADYPQESGLEGVARALLVPTRDDQQVAEQPIKIARVELSIGVLIPFDHLGREHGNVRGAPRRFLGDEHCPNQSPSDV